MLIGRGVLLPVGGPKHSQGASNDVVSHDEILHAISMSMHTQRENLEQDSPGGGDGGQTLWLTRTRVTRYRDAATTTTTTTSTTTTSTATATSSAATAAATNSTATATTAATGFARRAEELWGDVETVGFL